MKHIKKLVVAALLTACAAVTALAQIASADWTPTKPVRIIVPIVGSTNDVLARLVAPKLQEALGQPFVVENKPGAGGNIGAFYVTQAAPDGHTLLVGYNGPLAINVTLFEKMPYDPTKDLAPITLAVKAPQYLVLNPDTGIKNVQDFIDQAKANPTKFSYGSVALGSASHLTMEMMKSAANFHMTHIPYRGAGPAVSDLIAGNVQAGFFVPGNVQGFVKDGRLKLLASTGKRRFHSTPDIPTLSESGLKDFEATSWIGFLAPAGTPSNIINRYNKELVRILNSPEIKNRLQDMEFEVIASSPQQFNDWISAEIVRWGKVIKETGAKAD
ncbi:MAG: tripartite tricarboxylate transporter substrate binding protein [Gammaproteobacteria bacterium]|nr:tripartite tricarboxylate transporter substrate binding protein [Gammaproteobacteria bacterium]MBU0788180.1 tripartite tricarboxylate transporter substrate binding protein [Gammaproteobacteria bacterium]MBU0815323.1 tripartite tricarboxylate transporter substrate binding protein [Gammaproteobacteria bacterium]MBU1785569.1 tripartite tricarboxylate transporter substrate binding protein [Gammaproteobacteria bacterium]